MTKLRLALTRLFPASFRRAHGRELRAFIKDASADRTMSAPHLAGDLVVSILDAAHLLVRTSSNLESRQPRIAATLRSIDADMPLYDISLRCQSLRSSRCPWDSS